MKNLDTAYGALRIVLGGIANFCHGMYRGEIPRYSVNRGTRYRSSCAFAPIEAIWGVEEGKGKKRKRSIDRLSTSFDWVNVPTVVFIGCI